MIGDRSGVLAWALGTFHACAVGLLLLLLIFPGGGLGPLLGGLDTASGLVIFIALWMTSVWTTRHALGGGEWLADPVQRRVFFSRALRWGAATGVLFLAELSLIVLARTIVVAPSSIGLIGLNGIVGGAAFVATVGSLFAFVIGGVLGAVLGGLDLLALAVARKVIGTAMPNA